MQGKTADRGHQPSNGFVLERTEVQAQEILNMRLNRLTGLEQEKLTREYEEILETVRALLEILSDPARLMRVIREELEGIRDQYDDVRRTEIIQ